MVVTLVILLIILIFATCLVIIVIILIVVPATPLFTSETIGCHQAGGKFPSEPDKQMPRGNGTGTWVSQLVVVVDRRNGRNDFGVDVLQDPPILEGKNDVIEQKQSQPQPLIPILRTSRSWPGSLGPVRTGYSSGRKNVLADDFMQEVEEEEEVGLSVYTTIHPIQYDTIHTGDVRIPLKG